MKDVPDNWEEGYSPVEVTIARHGFTEFAMRAPQAFVLASQFHVSHGVANTTVVFIPRSRELIAALKAAQEPGETITVGTQSWTLERGTLIDPEGS